MWADSDLDAAMACIPPQSVPYELQYDRYTQESINNNQRERKWAFGTEDRFIFRPKGSLARWSNFPNHFLPWKRGKRTPFFKTIRTKAFIFLERGEGTITEESRRNAVTKDYWTKPTKLIRQPAWLDAEKRWKRRGFWDWFIWSRTCHCFLTLPSIKFGKAPYLRIRIRRWRWTNTAKIPRLSTHQGKYSKRRKSQTALLFN